MTEEGKLIMDPQAEREREIKARASSDEFENEDRFDMKVI